MKSERLTKRNAFGTALPNSYEPTNKEDFEMWMRGYLKLFADKLATYEDAEEQGRLVMLPCKDGGELFLADYYWDNIKRMTAGGIQLYCDFDGLEGSCMVPLSVIGKTVFLTREEAEAALKEHEGK